LFYAPPRLLPLDCRIERQRELMKPVTRECFTTYDDMPTYAYADYGDAAMPRASAITRDAAGCHYRHYRHFHYHLFSLRHYADAPLASMPRRTLLLLLRYSPLFTIIAAITITPLFRYAILSE
jgi:hypothetical protein